MDQLLPELWNLIANCDLVVFDKLRATSKLVGGWLTEPPLMFEGAPIDNITNWGKKYNCRNVSRGGVKLYCYTIRGIGYIIYRSGLMAALRALRRYNGPIPVFAEMTRITGGTGPTISNTSADVRLIMFSYLSLREYVYDVNISSRTVYAHISKVEEMLASGQWTT